MISFIHTADWQIGKQFSSIAGDTSALLRNQRILTIKQIAALAKSRHVDFVVVAGDLFEMNTVAGRTILQTIAAMSEFEGKWLVLPGNHDPAVSESVWTRITKAGTSDNIFLLTEPEPFFLRECNTVILPAPLQRRHDARDLTAWFDEFDSDEATIRIGLAHGSVKELLPERSDANNIVAQNRADTARLDYLALGDWHGTLKIGTRTWYCGTPEPDRFNDNDPGNILIVTLEGPGAQPKVEKVRTRHYLWQEKRINVYDAHDVLAIKATLKQLSVPLSQLVLKLQLEGTVSLQERATIQDFLATLAAEVCHLEYDTSALVAHPSEKDLCELGQQGFVQQAVIKLTAIMNDDNDPQSVHARYALQLLYLEHLQLEKL